MVPPQVTHLSAVMRLLSPSHLHLIIFFSLSFHFLSSQTSLASQCHNDQQLALLQFKHDSFSKSSSWKPETDCCSWKGITCDKATGNVIGLDLRNSELHGYIYDNSSLFKLHHLKNLDLSGILFGSSTLNSVANTVVASSPVGTEESSFNFSQSRQFLIPTGFSRLVNLTHLNLANSGFSGQVPLAMSHLKKLLFLDLSSNQLKLENPNLKMLAQNMSNLRELNLGGVDMSRQNSDWCQALSSAVPNLRVLSLPSCSLSGPIDSSLSHLHFLSEIILYNNNLSSEVPESLANVSSLTSIDLSYCNLQGEFPKEIFKLHNLQKIELSFNPNLLGSLPEFPEQSAFQHLSLSFTNFYGDLPQSLGNLKYLTDLLLANCNFSGRIPNSIANLTQLVDLDLSSNNFSGSIPSLVLSKNITQKLEGQPHLIPDSGLLNLLSLNLQNNSLDGLIDASLFTLPSLKRIQLNQNRFHGILNEVTNMPSPSLSQLDLSNNKLQGHIPRLTAELWSLEELILSSNNFSGTVELDMFSNLTKLSYLDLSENPLSITASSKLTFPHLWKFDVHSCRMAEVPSFLRNIPRLDHLDLSSSQIEGQIPNWIWMESLRYMNLSLNSLTGLAQPLPDASSLQLIYLDLHSNKIEGPIPFLSPYAAFLDYSGNKFSSVIPADISDYLFNATFFSVSRNKLVGEIPESICSSRAEFLQILDLSYNNLSGSIPKCLGDFSEALSVLNLGGNDLQGTMPQTYASSLRSLVLNGNRLEGMLPRSLSSCTSLEVLDLGNNQINDTFPFWLENLQKLQVLVLSSNKFHGPVGHSGSKNAFPLLHVIDLSSNGFTGHLPAKYFRDWKAITSVEEGNTQVKYLGSKYYHDSVTITMKGRDMLLVRILNIFSALDLSHNSFSGIIPELIGELKSLHVLDLSHNNLDGHIPSSLGTLRNLESLDLSENKLSGEIPLELTSLTFLSVLSLAWNDLEGIIPQGRQFATFPATSYEGNPKLCGFPLSRECEGSSEAFPPVQQQMDSGSTSEFDWKFAMMGYGCGLVAGVSIGYMLLWSENGYFATITLKCQQRPKNRRRKNMF